MNWRDSLNPSELAELGELESKLASVKGMARHIAEHIRTLKHRAYQRKKRSCGAQKDVDATA